MDPTRFKVQGQTMRIQDGFIGYTVIANERVRQDEDLSPVGWIRKGFGIADHAGIKDDFTHDIDGGTKGASDDGIAFIGQVQDDGVALFLKKGNEQ
jgi:hypothetical protein